MDWHEVALGAIGLLLIVGGFVWTQTVLQLGKLGAKMDAHQESDRLEFAGLNEKISQNQIAILSRISGRWGDR